MPQAADLTIRLNPVDDVVIARIELAPGTTLVKEGNLAVKGKVPAAHKVAVREVKALALAVLLLAVAEATAESKKLSATPNRHGAIAQYRPMQAWGVSYSFARQQDASVEALKQCANPKCEVVHKFRNGCGALADGTKKSAAASGATRAEAEAKALRHCEETNKGSCTLLAWGCTR